MAYMSQEHKKELAPGIKKVCEKYGMKCSIGVRHHSTLVININKGKLDLLTPFNAKRKATYDDSRMKQALSLPEYEPVTCADIYGDVSHIFSGKCLSFIQELQKAANAGNHDRSDVMADYFDVGWYVDINVGQWNKPYELLK